MKTRLVSVILTAVMMIITLAVSAVSVSADSIYDTAVNLASGKKQTFSLNIYDEKIYKVVLPTKGKLTVSINSNMELAYLFLFDANGNTVNCVKSNFTVGSGETLSDGWVYCTRNYTIGTFTGTVDYELKKGTYYISIKCDGGFTDGKTTLTVTYPSKEGSASKAKISYLTLEMEVGDTLRLGAVAEPTDAEVTWKSSKTSVAAVSASGKVTAKKEGATVITAKSGSSSQKIKIIVV